jgi:SAM-dependent methyltransferase
MSGGQLYDTIGATYTVTRRTEPRIAAQVWAALGDARTVLNVGAGTGSYEPPGHDVIAVEPSAVMRAQRPEGGAPCVAAAAESLPFEDQSFDAAMAFATVHHWRDPIAGLREMRRVARRVVVFTHDTTDTGWHRRFWLTRDYLPEVADLLDGRPSLTELALSIGARIEPVPIPWDCADGFFEAYWRRPEAYLDDHVRRGVSVWARVGPEPEQRAVRSLRADLASGRWADRNRDLIALEQAELGLRLLITGSPVSANLGLAARLLVPERLLRQRVIGGEDQRAAGAFLLLLLLRQLRSRCCVLDMDARDAAPARADRSDGGGVALTVGYPELEIVVLEQLDVDDGRGVMVDTGRLRVPGRGSSLRLVAGVGSALCLRCRGRTLRLRFTHRHDADVEALVQGDPGVEYRIGPLRDPVGVRNRGVKQAVGVEFLLELRRDKVV